MTTLDLVQVAGVIGTGVLVLLGAGRWAGALSSKQAELAKDQLETARILDAIGRKLDSERNRNVGEHTRLWMASTQTIGRVETLERMQGLPPPWKRTQPITPINPDDPPPEQDMFAAKDLEDHEQ